MSTSGRCCSLWWRTVWRWPWVRRAATCESRPCRSATNSSSSESWAQSWYVPLPCIANCIINAQYNLYTENWTLSAPLHLHRLKISHSDECPCGTGPQTTNLILQSCPTFDVLRCQTWPSPVDAHRKLWGPVERHCGRLRTSPYSPDWRSSMARNAEEEKMPSI